MLCTNASSSFPIRAWRDRKPKKRSFYSLTECPTNRAAASQRQKRLRLLRQTTPTARAFLSTPSACLKTLPSSHRKTLFWATIRTAPVQALLIGPATEQSIYQFKMPINCNRHFRLLQDRLSFFN